METTIVYWVISKVFESATLQLDQIGAAEMFQAFWRGSFQDPASWPSRQRLLSLSPIDSLSLSRGAMWGGA